MKIELRSVAFPEIEAPIEQPSIPPATFAARCDAAYEAAGKDWLVVYADREHQSNIAFLSGFEPRFEEALLVLGRDGQRTMLVGNECRSYSKVAGLPGLETRLAQSFSLMAQDRSAAPRLDMCLREMGMTAGDTVGIIGWKYLEVEERADGETGFFVPEFIVGALRQVVVEHEAVTDETQIMMHPAHGLGSKIDADQVAVFEWAAARASAAVARIILGAQAGDSEFAMAARGGYSGEPLSCHFMLASAGADHAVIGLRSPSARQPKLGDGVFTALGYWGGLSARGGLFSTSNDAFLKLAKGYFAGLIAWYEGVDIGVKGAEVYKIVEDELAHAGIMSALNPGHLTSYSEWTHSPIRSGSEDRIASGMPIQVDIIPSPLPDGWALNCEDPVVIADISLRQELQKRHPAVYERILARRTFVQDEIGIKLKDSILPLSSTPLWLPPFWLAAQSALARA